MFGLLIRIFVIFLLTKDNAPILTPDAIEHPGKITELQPTIACFPIIISPFVIFVQHSLKEPTQGLVIYLPE